MNDQLDMFAGTEFEPPPKPIVKRKPTPVEAKVKTKSGYTIPEEEMVLAFAAKWEVSGARDKLDTDYMKFKDGKRVELDFVLQYHALVKKIMRESHVNAKHYELDGYGTTRMAIVAHDGGLCMKFNHRETDDSIYIKLQ